MATLLYALKIYACLLAVVGTHELGHFIALKLAGCKVTRLTIFYGGIFKFWDGKTFYSFGFIPGGFNEATGVDKLDIWAFLVVSLSGLVANIFCFYIVSIACMVWDVAFFRMLQMAFLFAMFTGLIPFGNNDMAKVFKKLISNNYE